MLRDRIEAIKFIGAGAAVGVALGLISLFMGGPERHTYPFMNATVRNLAVATLGGAFTGLLVARIFNKI